MINARYRYSTIAVIFTSGLLAACTPYLSSSTRDASDSEGQGLAYYLPMRYVTMTYEYKKRLDVGDATQKLATARAEQTAGEKRLKVAETAKAAAAARLASYKESNVGSDSAIYLDAAKAKIDAELEEKPAKDALAALKTAVATAEKILEEANSNTEYVDRFAIQLQPLVADPNRRFVLRDRHSPLRSDTAVLKTTTGGLLTSVTSKAEDQTQEILVALAQSAAAVRASPSARLREVPAPATDGNCPSLSTKAIKIEQTIDPIDSDAINRYVAAVNKARCGSTSYPFVAYTFPQATVVGSETDLMKIRSLVTSSSNTATTVKELQEYLCLSKDDPGCTKRKLSVDASRGIAYRRERPVLFTIAQAKSGVKNDQFPEHCTGQLACPLVASFVLHIPNGAPVEVLPMTVGSFGKVIRDVEFEYGMLKALDTKQESELLKVASLPYAVVRAAVSAVSEIVRLRVDVSSNKTSLADAEKKRAEAEEALREALEKIRQVQTDSENSTGN